MDWYREFPNQNYGVLTYKHINLPLIATKEFDFYRCLEFENDFYGRTVSTLFNGNLRKSDGRYSDLFPNKKVSYWADSPSTALAEIRKHGAKGNVFTFWAYDDTSSTFPTLQNQEILKIVDGRECGIQEILDKVDQAIELSTQEHSLLKSIMAEKPDCLAYNSHARKGGVNYIFFEEGFHKLSLRELRLRFCSEDGGSHSQVACAISSDYSPILESYGKYFLPKARVKMDNDYLISKEYLSRKKIYEKSLSKMRNEQLMY